jgi:hypothetical protein
METWSHAQAVYDILGVERINGNQIRNVAHIGWTTFGCEKRIFCAILYYK